MKFDKNYNYRDIFNNIRSDSSYHGYLINRFQSESIQNVIQNTGHEAKEAKRNTVFSIYLIPKMLLGERKKEYFGRKVTCIYCIYVLLCINCDKEWQEPYENPIQLARHYDI